MTARRSFPYCVWHHKELNMLKEGEKHNSAGDSGGPCGTKVLTHCIGQQILQYSMWRQEVDKGVFLNCLQLDVWEMRSLTELELPSEIQG